MKSLLLITLIASLLTVTACKEGEKKAEAPSVPILSSDVEVLDYNSTSVEVELKGEIAIADVNPLDSLEIYTDFTCQGDIVGRTTAQDFQLGGVVLDLPIDEKVDLYLSTASSGDCLLFSAFDPAVLSPGNPTLREFSPVSPSKATFMPGVFGTAYPNSSNVKFYDDSGCTNHVGGGPAADYSSIGIQVTLTANTLNSVYGQTEDPLGRLSECTSLGEFRHANTTLESPSFVSVSPASPNNVSGSPIIMGSSPALAETVKLYADSACSVLLNEGTPAQFSGAGLLVALSANATNSVYAQVEDSLNNKSVCTYMTSYIYDTIGPAAPSFASISPPSPTNNTTTPLLTGSGPADSLSVEFYDSSLCIIGIGSGLTSGFSGGGLVATVPADSTTDIYARTIDAAGNTSNCTFMTSYKHNTVPPEIPTFGGTNPISPTNGTLEPLVFGSTATYTTSLDFYSEENCTDFVGSGTTTTYEGVGITATLTANTVSTIYVRVWDLEGNESACNFLGSYDHSNTAAPNVGYSMTFPSSPTRASNQPFIIGTADGTIANVRIYDDNTCTNQLGTGTRAQFTASGIQVSVPVDSTTDLHAVATDVYGNDSSCSFLTQFIHNTIVPSDPVFGSISPTSPNNLSFNPTISGVSSIAPGSQLPPNEVEFYDSAVCVNKLGEGTPTDFSGAGIVVNAYRNAVTSIYAKSFDAAGNFSNCVHMLDYTHDDLQPGRPTFLTATPWSPSFNPVTRLVGAFAPSTDFLNKVSVGIYSDSGCSSLIVSGDPTAYESTGITVTVSDNVTTSLYANSVNEVGTASDCGLLYNFRHYDLPPPSMAVSSGLNGSVNVNWFPDPVSSSPLTYSVERSLNTNGPYSVVAAGLVANSYNDISVENGEAYYYRVVATNSTGRSQYTSPAVITISAPPAEESLFLIATPGVGRVNLSWGGFAQNMTYKIFRATQEGGPFAQLPVSPTGSPYDDNTAVNGTTYFYYVLGTNPSGDSVRSPVASTVAKNIPSAPTDFKIEPVRFLSECGGSAGLKMSWVGSPYFDNYQMSTTGGTNLGTSSNTSYVVCGQGPNNNTRFRVAASFGGVLTANSNATGFAAAGDAGLQAHAGDSEVALSWTYDMGAIWGGAGLSEYSDVYRSTSAQGPFTKIASQLTVQNYTDSTAVNGTAYFYYVQNYQLHSSGEIRFIGYPSLVEGATPGSAPTAPTNLILNEDFTLGIKLDWTGSSRFNNYNIYYASSPGGPWLQINQTVNNFRYGVTSFEGMNYYRVTAAWGSSETAPSNVVSFRQGTIVGLTAVSNVSDIQLDWTDVPGVQDYVVFRSTINSGGFATLATPSSSDFTDSTALADQGYFYKILARFSDATDGQLSDSASGLRLGATIPTGVSATDVTGSSMMVHWTSIPSSTRYEVHLATSIGGPYTKVAEVSGLLSRFVSGLTPNTQYFFFVRVLVSGVFNDSNIVTIETLNQPSAPVTTVKNNEVNLSWSPSVGATDYDVLRSSDGVNFTNVVTNQPATSYLDTGALNGSSYFYKLRVNYPLGSVTSDSTPAVTPGVVPLAPSGLSLRSNGTGTQALLSWAPAEGAINYKIYQASSPGGPFTALFNSGIYQDQAVTGLTTGNTYYFRVSSLNGDVESGFSNVVGFQAELDPPAPTAQKVSAGSVTIAWAAVTGADEYDLYRSEADGDFDLVASGLTGLGYEDATITTTLTYFYRYQPRTTGGVYFPRSAASQPVNLSIQPEAPLGVNAILTGATTAEINWVGSPFPVNDYEILRSTTSGGPYSSLGTVTGTTSYTDSTLAGSTSYFYVIRALNSSWVESVYSSEVAVRTTGGPGTLVGSNLPGGISLTWGAVGGAASYNVYRSEESGGPYGYIANTAMSTYLDVSTSPNVVYYYIVRAVFAGAATSENSPEEMVLRAGVIDLEVPVELTDMPLASVDSESRRFERTRTRLDTTDYDGVVTYRFEVAGLNRSATPRAVRLIDGSNVILAAITIPASVTSSTRYDMTFTPNAGEETYRLELEQTTAGYDVEVYQARMLVHQVGATKTRLYFPLLVSDGSVLSDDAEAYIASTQTQGFSDIATAMTFTRRVSQLQKVVDYNAWEIEALVSTTNSVTGSVRFYNKTSGAQVPQTETNYMDSNIQMARIAIDEEISEWGAANEGDEYKLQMSCDLDCSFGEVRIHKAGLWVKLENLSKAYSFYRNSSVAETLPSGKTYTDTRTYLDLSRFSGEQVYLEAEATDGMTDSANVELLSHGSDFGAIGTSSVASSSLNFDFDGPKVLRSSALTVSSGDRFVTGVNSVTGTLDFVWSAVIVEANQP